MLYFDEKQYNCDPNLYRDASNIKSSTNLEPTCGFETILVENYFTYYYYPYIFCQDACYNPLTGTYTPTGSTKFCGWYAPTPPHMIRPPRCCVYWHSGTLYYHEYHEDGLCPTTGPNHSNYWTSCIVNNDSECNNTKCPH
ncbi:hypothetical protein [Clostridium sp. HBUAS56017]|uniref:hypothetical protein n=1 Tax=Clostridium sp. HBUAS56017 TaxID=2571128 RepID=UPI001177F8A8|nr:hypothetical protein [Clostridium sp. HBUAS56017]